MNCRPGDLARIVGVHPDLGLNDKIVKLTDEPAHVAFGVPHWNLANPVKVVMRRVAVQGLHIWLPGDIGTARHIPDANLRPIRDPGDDAVDETLIYAGDPKVREVSHG